MTKEQLLKRLRSLGWRALCMALVAGLNFIAENLTGFGLSPTVQAFLGLLLGEISKYFNANQDMFGMIKK